MRFKKGPSSSHPSPRQHQAWLSINLLSEEQIFLLLPLASWVGLCLTCPRCLLFSEVASATSFLSEAGKGTRCLYLEFGTLDSVEFWPVASDPADHPGLAVHLTPGHFSVATLLGKPPSSLACSPY